MGDLRDMLLKAGLVSAEQAKKVEEAKQVDQRPKGHGLSLIHISEPTRPY